MLLSASFLFYFGTVLTAFVVFILILYDDNVVFEYCPSYSFSHLIYASSWSWLYGSWIYNYLCKQCISPLTLWVRTRSGEVYSIQLYAIIFVSDLRQIGFLRVSSTNTNCRHDTTGIISNKILFKLRSDAYKYFYFVKKKTHQKNDLWLFW